MHKLSCARVKVIFLYLFTALIFVSTVRAQDESRYDKIVQYYVTTQNFMGTVLVAKDSEILFNKGFGSANLEWDIPNSPTTKFRIFSVTKQFTAASILLLEERGKLKMDDPIKKYLPDAWEKITIFHLLTNTSGIPEILLFPEYTEGTVSTHTPRQLVDIFIDKPLDFKPGEKYSYSNSGYILLGYLLEKVSGETYQDFLQKNIFDPLGMKDSGYDSNSVILPQRAAGYSHGSDGLVNADYINMSNPFSAAALYSTAEDLLRWEQGLFGGKLLSKESLSKMTTPYKGNYALGLKTGNDNGHRFIWHEGDGGAFVTYLTYYPDDKITIAVLSNAAGKIPAVKLAAIARGEEVILPSERKEITVPAEILSQYVGTYELRPGLNMMITLDGDRLMSQESGGSKMPLFPESETKFFLKRVDAVIEFFKDESGKVTHLKYTQNDVDNKLVKISDTVLERKEIKLSTDILSQYVGTYELRPGINVIITLEGDQLISKITGQAIEPVNPLFAETEAKFFYKDIDATIEFFKDSKGAISYLILKQGEQEGFARRTGYEKEPDPIDGTWTGTADRPDGNPMEVTYVFEAFGKKLVGTMETRLGVIPFSKGKIDGNKIAFIVRTDPSTMIETTGTISGDEINIIQRNGDDVIEFIVSRISK